MIGKHLNSLASVASRYQKVLEENRKLYNQVQDLKGKFLMICTLLEEYHTQILIGLCIDGRVYCCLDFDRKYKGVLSNTTLFAWTVS